MLTTKGMILKPYITTNQKYHYIFMQKASKLLLLRNMAPKYSTGLQQFIC